MVFVTKLNLSVAEFETDLETGDLMDQPKLDFFVKLV